MSTSNNSGLPSTPPSYTPPSTSRFLAFGKLNSKYPFGLGQSVPSTFSDWPRFTREVPPTILSALPSESVPRSASVSSTSESEPRSLQSSPLLPNNCLLAQPRKSIVDDQDSASDAEPEASPLQHENDLALYSAQDPTSVIPHFIFPPAPKARNPTWINPLLSHIGFAFSGYMLRWNMTKAFDTIEVPSDSNYLHVDLGCVPAFRPDLPQVNVSIGEAPAYKATFNAPRTTFDEGGDLVYSVARFLRMVEMLLSEPLEKYYWNDISIYNKIDLLYAMAARLRVPIPLYIADFREKELNGLVNYSQIDAFQMEALQRTADKFARDPYTGQIRVLGKDFLGEQTVFHGIDWDNSMKEFKIITTRPAGCSI